jgi:putative sigma-54 modulation protein
MANKVETNNVEIVGRNMRLTDNTREYVEKKAAKLPRHLPGIDDIRVELTHIKTARNANDRHVAQITVRGKKFLLRTEERADDLHAAFDTALEKIKRQMDRYKGKHYHGRGDGRSAAEVLPEEEMPLDETGELLPLIARRKKFIVLPMTEDEAIEQMRLLGHDNFFIFFNPEQNTIQVLYRRRNGTYGLIEPVVG